MGSKSEIIKGIDFRGITSKYGLRHRVLEGDDVTTVEFAYLSASAVVGIGLTSESETPWVTGYSLDYDDRRAAIHLMKSLNDYFDDFAFSVAESMDIKSILYQSQVGEREEGTFTTQPEA